ncbi:MAG: CotH kinase family protein [Lachnospiraceae bacterium]|nr:CotH kinase family protein [Lachnospiraceae bacterium]
MKFFSKYITIALFCILVSGCSGNRSASYSVDIKDLTDIPVLTIETKSTAKDVMNFVTKPVTRHVAESIASWTPGYVMPPAPYYEACTVSLTDTDRTVLLDAVDAEVKVRGNWTTSYEKKPLRIKFTESQNLLGLNDGATFKNWLLLAEYKDASLLRNKAALAMAEELLADDELYVSDAEFVEVVINGQYWGVYLLAEQQQVNKDRVNITEVPEGYTGTDIGYFMEFDGYYMNEDPLQRFHVDYADNAALVPFDGEDGNGETMKCLSDPEYGRKNDIGITIKSDIYDQAQRNFIASFVNNVYNIMYAAAYYDEAYIFNDTYTEIYKTTEITPQEAVERVVNISSLADTYLINELLCDADVYWSSFFLSADFGPEGDKKLTFEAHWDFDSAMGNKNRCVDGTGFYAANIVPDVNGGPGRGGEYNTLNPWLAVLAYEDWYQDIIRENWTKAFDSGAFERIYTMLGSDQERCKPAFDRNYTKWNNINHSSIASELSRESAACSTQEQAYEFLSDWLKKRVEFLNDYWHS